MLSVHGLMQEARLPGRGTRPRRAGQEERRRIAAAIDDLPEVERLVLGLRYYESIGAAQIAQVVDLDEAEVREILTEAARRVVTGLGVEGGPPSVRPGRRGRGAGSDDGRSR